MRGHGYKGGSGLYFRGRSRYGRYYTRNGDLFLGLVALLFGGLFKTQPNQKENNSEKSNDGNISQKITPGKKLILIIYALFFVGIGIYYLTTIPGTIEMNNKLKEAELMATDWINKSCKDYDSFRYVIRPTAKIDKYAMYGDSIRIDTSIQYMDIEFGNEGKCLWQRDYTFWMNPNDMQFNPSNSHVDYWDLTHPRGSY